MRFRPGFSVRLAAVAVVAAWGALLSGQARAYEFVDIATYTTSTTQTVGHACVLYNGTDMSCASTNPYVTSAGLVGIGTSNPTTALEVSGTVSATHFVGDGAGLTGIAPNVSSGLSGSIVYRDEFGGLHASSGFSISSTTGSVGIGAGAASWLGNNGLYVTGEGYFGSGLILTDDQILTWGWTAPAAAISGSWATKSLSFITNQAEAMRIVSSGNVGIGTSTPQGKLDVHGQTFFENGNVDGTYGDQVFFGAAPVGYPSTYLHKIKTSHSLDPNIGGMIFSLSDGTETGYRDVLTLKETGNVGIGTTSPANKFTVLTTDAGYYAFHATTTPDVMVAGSNPVLHIGDTGNVAGRTATLRLGTVHSTYYSDSAFVQAIQGGGVDSYNLALGTSNAGAATEKMRITTTGNVGIGVAAPSTTLHVSGTLRLADGGEACDANRAGAIKYSGGVFSFCAGSAWGRLREGAESYAKALASDILR